MGAAVLVWILFLAWLMWSSKVQKELFLFYLWSSAIVMIIAEAAYHLLIK